MKILYVEDNEINAFIMERSLRQYDLDVAVNGTQALSMVQDTTYDLILMDINLGPDQKDGSQIMDEIKLIERYKSVPFYAVTAYAMVGDEERFLKRGFDKYFSKPVDFKSLKQAIQFLQN